MYYYYVLDKLLQVNKCMGKKGVNGCAKKFFWKTNTNYNIDTIQ